MSEPSACDRCSALLLGDQPICFGCLLSRVPIDLDLHNLELGDEIGRGGMGVVYRARQLSLDRPVAVKLMTNHQDDPGFRARFAREAMLLARLNHPNIVIIYDWVQDAEDPYLIMEFVDGEPLSAEIPMTPKRAIEVGIEICRALEHAHRHGVIHRDIKPSNVLLASDGSIKVADFGIARPTGSQSMLTSTNAVVGTPLYTAPEASSDIEPSPSLDVYSVGILLFHAITDSFPVGSFDAIEHPIDSVLRLAMAQDPKRRLATAAELRAALESIDSADAAPMTAKSRSQRGQILTVGAASLTVIALAAFGLVWKARSSNPDEGRGEAEVGTFAIRTNKEPLQPIEKMDSGAAFADAPTSVLAAALDAGPGLPVAKPNPKKPEDKPTPIAVANGELTIHARPWANVSINGRPIGRVEPPHGRQLSLKPGRYQVILRNPVSGRTITRPTTIRSASKSTVRADLRSQKDAKTPN